MILLNAVLCLALNVYFEARGESVEGQHAIAQVTMNRAAGDEKNVCKVVMAPKQFSWTAGKVNKRGDRYVIKSLPEKDDSSWEQAMVISKLHIAGWKMPDYRMRNIMYYHAKYVRPGWAKHMKPVQVIGAHIFYKPKKEVKFL